MVNKAGIIVEYNTAMSELTGYTHKEIPDIKTWLFNVYLDKEYRIKVSKIIKKISQKK